MISSRAAVSCRALASSGAVKAFGTTSIGLRSTTVILQRTWTTPSHRQFSTTQVSRLKEFFPISETKDIKETPPAWPHPIYTKEQMENVKVAHREVRDWRDRTALIAIRTLRWGLDLVSGYRHNKAVKLNAKDPKAAASKYQMTEYKYMIRNIFLESVAGVPGMVAGMMRHLKSMRTMQRDNGWIETLLEESYNERMHLLTFLKMAEPGWFMRLAVLGAQGVFFNAFFIAYAISPQICHRFVGYLEEEAVLTYTRELEDLDAGRLPLWEKMIAPEIAIKYWHMPEGARTMRHLLEYIRADEAKHREVNHTLANLDQKHDPNPYVSKYKDPTKPHPTKGIEHLRGTGWERSDVL